MVITSSQSACQGIFCLFFWSRSPPKSWRASIATPSLGTIVKLSHRRFPVAVYDRAMTAAVTFVSSLRCIGAFAARDMFPLAAAHTSRRRRLASAFFTAALLVTTGVPTSSFAAPPAPRPPQPTPPRPADKPVITLHLLDLDTAPTVGKPFTIRARLDDPRGAVFGLRFTVNGRAGA